MNWSQVFHRLQFDQEPILHQEVGTETFIKCQAHEPDGNGNLAPHLNASLGQHFGQNDFINGLQQPWPRLNVKPIAAIHHDARELLRIPSWLRVFV